MADAVFVRDAGEYLLTAATAIGLGEVYQLPDGRAAAYRHLSNRQAQAATTGQRALFETEGHFTLTKATGVVLLDGGRAYWDHSANNVTYLKVNDKDFYLGVVVGDAASGEASCVVDLNVQPRPTIDALKDPCLSVLVGTPAAGGFGYPVFLGGRAVLELTATSEAQKVDLLTVDGFDLAANAIVEAVFCIMNDGSNATQDFTIGVASGTHASDFQSVTSFVAVSTVGNSTNINAQSDDNAADVAPTDTTADYVEGSAVANRVEVWFDFRNPADVQIYVNGALVLAATTFTAGTSGTHFLIAHLEKTSGTDVYKVGIDRLCARLCEQHSDGT